LWIFDCQVRGGHETATERSGGLRPTDEKRGPILSQQPQIGDGHPPRAPYDLSPVILASFVLTGTVTTLLGPILPVISSKWLLSDLGAGDLFLAQFLGSTFGTIISGFLIVRLGFDRLLAVGFGVMALGVAALGLTPWPTCIVAVTAYGVALGLTIPAINLFVSENNPQRPAAALSILNAAWSIGAVVSPPLVALLIVPGARIGRLLGLAAMLAIVAFFIPILKAHRAPASLEETPSGRDVMADSSRGRFDLRVWLRAQGFVFAALFFLYVGIENSVGGWVATYAHRLTGQPGARWGLARSLFWGALILGGILVPTILRYLSEARLVTAGLLVTTLGVTALLISNSLMSVFLSVSLAGLGLSSVFPTTIALLTQCFGRAASPAGAPMFGFAALGGACLPWVVGFLSSQFASIRVGLWVPLLAILAMLAVNGLLPTAGQRADKSRGE